MSSRYEGSWGWTPERRAPTEVTVFANLVCPISHLRIDRNVVRINGLVTTLLLVAYVLTRQPAIIVPIGLDYVLRARMTGPTSPMTWLARRLARALKVRERPMDKASKVFASRIGVCFALGAAVCHFVAPTIAVGLAGALSVFTALESVGDLCVGCVVYTYIALPLNRAREAVLAIPLFAKLDDAMLVSLAERFRVVAFPEGERILAEGSAGDEMFVLRAGEVEVYRESASGERTVIGTYKPGQWFGEMALLGGGVRSASARALTSVSALRLGKADLDRLLERHPRMRTLLERTAEQRTLAEAGAQAG